MLSSTKLFALVVEIAVLIILEVMVSCASIEVILILVVLKHSSIFLHLRVDNPLLSVHILRVISVIISVE
jgi:hypothetical protein